MINYEKLNIPANSNISLKYKFTLVFNIYKNYFKWNGQRTCYKARKYMLYPSEEINMGNLRDLSMDYYSIYILIV